MIQYEIDEETRVLLEAALNMLAQVAEQQVNDEGLAAVYAIANDIADRFGIPHKVATVEEHEDGTIVVSYTEDDDDDIPDPDNTQVH